MPITHIILTSSILNMSVSFQLAAIHNNNDLKLSNKIIKVEKLIHKR